MIYMFGTLHKNSGFGLDPKIKYNDIIKVLQG